MKEKASKKTKKVRGREDSRFGFFAKMHIAAQQLIQCPKNGNGKETVVVNSSTKIQAKQSLAGTRHSASGAWNMKKIIKGTYIGSACDPKNQAENTKIREEGKRRKAFFLLLFFSFLHIQKRKPLFPRPIIPNLILFITHLKILLTLLIRSITISLSH